MWAAGEGDVGNSLIGKPGEEGVGITGDAGDSETLATDGYGEHGGELGGSGLPTAAVEAKRCAGDLAGGEQRQSLNQVKAVGENNRRDWSPIGGDSLLPGALQL